MNANIDMSEIIEFVMPSKVEFPDQDDDGDEDDDNDSNNQYVVLDAVDVGREYKNEEFLLINEDDYETEMIIENPQLRQQLISNNQSQQSMLRMPKEEPLDDIEYTTEENDPEEGFDDLVEEEVAEEEEEEEEHYQQQYEQYDDDGEQPQQIYEWNYLQNSSPESDSEVVELETPMSSPAPRNQIPATNSKIKSQSQNNVRNAIVQPTIIDNTYDDTYEEVGLATTAEQVIEEPVQLAVPSDKMLDLFKGPRRYMLFDELIATIVDFDEDGTPIVEFSMMGSSQDEKLPVECGICPDVMHKSKLSKHQKSHLVPGTNRYACIYCTETYRDCKYLAGHARRHMGIRPYVCEPCKLYFSTKQDLRVHNQRRHLKKEHICEMCGKTFAQNTQLKRHREATHEKKRRFQCQYCQKAYYKNFSLQEHIRNVHMGKRRMLKCPFCGMQCRDAHKMARHRKEMHLNQDTYVCHLCQEEFTDINYFDAHKRSIQCRSNTRRLVTEDEFRANKDSQFVTEADELPGMLEEEYDEDTGLLIEPNKTDQQKPNNEIMYETVNGNYLHEVADDDEQYVQQYEHNNYVDESLLVEQVGEDDEQNEQLLGDDEQYLQPMDEIEQENYQNVQTKQQLGQEYNDDELIYEITLETEDN